MGGRPMLWGAAGRRGARRGAWAQLWEMRLWRERGLRARARVMKGRQGSGGPGLLRVQSSRAAGWILALQEQTGGPSAPWVARWAAGDGESRLLGRWQVRQWGRRGGRGTPVF